MSKPVLVLRLGYVSTEDKLNNAFLKNKYGDKRKFYSSQQDYDFVKYASDGSKEKIDYLAYSGNKEKSDGIFGINGLLSKEEKAELRRHLRKTQSVIWHGVIAFESEFGKRYVDGMDDVVKLLKMEFPKFFKSAGLKPDNITWYAGLHTNTKSKHIHFSFFENEPLRNSKHSISDKRYSYGQIRQEAMDRFKIGIEQRLTDISSELKQARKNLMDISKSVLFSQKNRVRNLTEVQEGVTEIMRLLPKKGKLQYDSDNMTQLRPKINRVIDLLIKTEPTVYTAFIELCRTVIERDKETKRMLEANKIEQDKWSGYLIFPKMTDDIYRRLGNYVINTARMLRNKEKSTKCRYVRKRMGKQSLAAAMTYSLKLGERFEEEAIDAFKEYMRKLDEYGRESKEREMEEYEMD